MRIVSPLIPSAEDCIERLTIVVVHQLLKAFVEAARRGDLGRLVQRITG